MNVKEIQALLGQKFIHVEQVIACMYYGYEAAQTGTLGNVVLFGPRGHGKSQLCQAFFEVMGHTPYEAQMSAFTKPEHLFGIPDIELLKKGTLQYNMEGSFLDYEYAIFEELFDATSILQMMKAILTDGQYCAGGKTCYKSKTKFILAPTNMKPADWYNATDSHKVESFKAFADRFPFSTEVVWPSYTAYDYALLIERVLKLKSDAFAEMMAYAHKQGSTISPRTAIIAAKSYASQGVEPLQFFEGVSPEVFEKFKDIDGKSMYYKHIQEWLSKAKQILKNGKASPQAIKTTMDELTRYTVDDHALNSDITQQLTHLAELRTQVEQKFLETHLYGSRNE
jgi:hypothetical protein